MVFRSNGAIETVTIEAIDEGSQAHPPPPSARNPPRAPKRPHSGDVPSTKTERLQRRKERRAVARGF
jgi:hypothetical protein